MRRAGGRLFDQPTRNPIARQFMRHHKASWACPDDQHVCQTAHYGLLSLLIAVKTRKNPKVPRRSDG
jgi:hypothetical protein